MRFGSVGPARWNAVCPFRGIGMRSIGSDAVGAILFAFRAVRTEGPLFVRTASCFPAGNADDSPYVRTGGPMKRKRGVAEPFHYVAERSLTGGMGAGPVVGCLSLGPWPKPGRSYCIFGIIALILPCRYGSVAQLDRATAFKAVGRAFEPRRNHRARNVLWPVPEDVSFCLGSGGRLLLR